MNRAVTFGVGGILALLLVVVGAMFVFDAAGKDTTADDVRVATVGVGGMERDEAAAQIRRRLAGMTDEPVAVMFRDTHYVLRSDVAKARIDLDATVDAALDADEGETVGPRVTFARGAVQAFAGRIAERVNREPRDADIDWQDGKLDRTRARAGLAVNEAALVARLERVMANPALERRIDVPVKVTERPDRTFEDLAKRYPAVIAVDRDAKRLRLYKNLKLEKRYEIAVGKAGTETTAGRYKIVEKIVNPPWHAPNKAWAGELAGQTIPPNDPRNPLEARWMGFHDGQGIHGTEELSSLGSAASHGCIRMSVPAVEQLFREVKVGTPLFLQ
ncbi:MAG: L,D-transpeptidase/peptidoglycan binding protein [Actinomycetota bacterium]|nr:L,D-transpeptidase/peptidoglycan binding protein [Actinomycetota bacterium]